MTFRKLDHMFKNPRFDVLKDTANNPFEFNQTLKGLIKKYNKIGKLNFRKLVKMGFLKMTRDD